MENFIEIAVRWNYWRECVKRLKMLPNSKECQRMSLWAQMDLVTTQALYWNGVKP